MMLKIAWTEYKNNQRQFYILLNKSIFLKFKIRFGMNQDSFLWDFSL